MKNNMLKQEFELWPTSAKSTRDQAASRLAVDVDLSENRSEILNSGSKRYKNDAKERASLLNEMQNLQKASERINTEAENLTKALKGGKKLQGNYVELVLGACSKSLVYAKTTSIFCSSAATGQGR